MLERIRLLAGAMLAAVLFVLSTTAPAATRTFNGTLVAGGPTIPVVSITPPNCTGQGSTPVLYRAIPFTVSVAGSYTITEGTANTAVYLYQYSFNPGAPGTANCVGASNANPISLTLSLTTGRTYFLVVIEDTFAQTGLSFSATITGPGNIDDAPCSVFTDVDPATTFCDNVQWLRNRGVTLGCAATLYCPDSNVTRLQMAAFMNRLGNALAPTFLHQTETSAAPINNSAVMCQTSDYAVAGYPRVATPASAMLYHGANTTVRVDTRIVFSTNAGASWSNFGTFVTAAGNPPSSYASQSPAAGPVVFQPGTSVRFGIQPTKVGVDLVFAGGCELTVRLESQTGTIPPFDPVPAPPGATTPSGG